MLSSQSSEGSNPISAFILDFQSPELYDNTFLLFKSHILWYFVTVAEEANTHTQQCFPSYPRSGVGTLMLMGQIQLPLIHPLSMAFSHTITDLNSSDRNHMASKAKIFTIFTFTEKFDNRSVCNILDPWKMVKKFNNPNIHWQQNG